MPGSPLDKDKTFCGERCWTAEVPMPTSDSGQCGDRDVAKVNKAEAYRALGSSPWPQIHSDVKKRIGKVTASEVTCG